MQETNSVFVIGVPVRKKWPSDGYSWQYYYGKTIGIMCGEVGSHFEILTPQRVYQQSVDQLVEIIRLESAVSTEPVIIAIETNVFPPHELALFLEKLDRSPVDVYLIAVTSRFGERKELEMPNFHDQCSAFALPDVLSEHLGLVAV